MLAGDSKWTGSVGFRHSACYRAVRDTGIARRKGEGVEGVGAVVREGGDGFE